MDDEDYIHVLAWDEQCGQWYTVYEFKTVFQAELAIKALMSDPENEHTAYAWEHYKRKVFKQ